MLSSFEIVLFRVTSAKPSLTIAVIYGLPDSNNSVFYEELFGTVDKIIVATSDHLLFAVTSTVRKRGPTDPRRRVHGMRLPRARTTTRAHQVQPNTIACRVSAGPNLALTQVRVEPAGCVPDHCLVMASVAFSSVQQLQRHSQLRMVDLECRLQQPSLFAVTAVSLSEFEQW